MIKLLNKIPNLKGQYVIFITVRYKVRKNCFVKFQWCHFFWGRGSHHTPSLSVDVKAFLFFLCMFVYEAGLAMCVSACLLQPTGTAIHTYLSLLDAWTTKQMAWVSSPWSSFGIHDKMNCPSTVELWITLEGLLNRSWLLILSMKWMNIIEIIEFDLSL